MRAAQGEAYLQPHRPLRMSGDTHQAYNHLCAGDCGGCCWRGGWTSPICSERQRRV